MKGIFITIIIVLVLLIVGFFVFNDDSFLIDEDEIPGDVDDGTEEESEEEEMEDEGSLINGKTVEERMDEVRAMLHQPGSEEHFRDNFPDLTLVYTDYAEGSIHPDRILPFEYYYSAEADKTVSLCAIERTVMICDGLLDQLITIEDIDNGRCQVVTIYLTGEGDR